MTPEEEQLRMWNQQIAQDQRPGYGALIHQIYAGQPVNPPRVLTYLERLEYNDRERRRCWRWDRAIKTMLWLVMWLAGATGLIVGACCVL